MNFEDYQKEVLQMPLYDDLFKGIMGELGEVAELVKKHERQGQHRKIMTRERFEEEMGDVLWYLSRLASAYGGDLQKIAEGNIQKLRERHGLK